MAIGTWAKKLCNKDVAVVHLIIPSQSLKKNSIVLPLPAALEGECSSIILAFVRRIMA